MIVHVTSDGGRSTDRELPVAPYMRAADVQLLLARALDVHPRTVTVSDTAHAHVSGDVMLGGKRKRPTVPKAKPAPKPRRRSRSRSSSPKGRHAFREFTQAYFKGEKARGRSMTYKQCLKECAQLWHRGGK